VRQWGVVSRAVGGAVLPREGRWLAAVLACGPSAVLSHVTAAVHWNLLNYDAPRPEVTARASRRGVPEICLHRSHSLDAPDHPGLEADCCFPTYRVVIETDGWDTHRTRHAFKSDRAKDAALTAAGYTVVRFTYRQLRDDPNTVADRIKAILAARYSVPSASRNSASSESSIE
jgi:Protein of unknown function (DUF559)